MSDGQGEVIVGYFYRVRMGRGAKVGKSGAGLKSRRLRLRLWVSTLSVDCVYWGS